MPRTACKLKASRKSKILCAVTASQDAIEAAIAEQADVLLVHHGYFWKGEPYPITGMRGKRIKSLIQHDISLVGYHLPLDSHPELGNNAAIADILGLEQLEALDPSERHPIGNIGYLKQAMSPEAFKALLSEKLGFDTIHLPANPTEIRKVGFCTGGAQDYIHKAAAQDCDAYISGEVSERTFMKPKNWASIIMPVAITRLNATVYSVWDRRWHANLISNMSISN